MSHSRVRLCEKVIDLRRSMDSTYSLPNEIWEFVFEFATQTPGENILSFSNDNFEPKKHGVVYFSEFWDAWVTSLKTKYSILKVCRLRRKLGFRFLYHSFLETSLNQAIVRMKLGTTDPIRDLSRDSAFRRVCEIAIYAALSKI